MGKKFSQGMIEMHNKMPLLMGAPWVTPNNHAPSQYRYREGCVIICGYLWVTQYLPMPSPGIRVTVLTSPDMDRWHCLPADGKRRFKRDIFKISASKIIFEWVLTNLTPAANNGTCIELGDSCLPYIHHIIEIYFKREKNNNTVRSPNKGKENTTVFSD